MEAIASLRLFGESRYEASIDQWKPDKDISLYLFYQPITVDKLCLSAFSDKLNEMYKKVNDSPKMYFVMYFEKDDWGGNQTEILNYKFFEKAKILKD